MVSEEERRRLKAEYKQQQRVQARDSLILSEEELASLLDNLLATAADEVCDHSPRFTRAWAAANGIDPDALTASLANLGGYCDCEVLANVDPDEIF